MPFRVDGNVLIHENVHVHEKLQSLSAKTAKKLWNVIQWKQENQRDRLWENGKFANCRRDCFSHHDIRSACTGIPRLEKYEKRIRDLKGRHR